MNKENVVCLYNGMLFSKEREANPAVDALEDTWLSELTKCYMVMFTYGT